MNLNLFTKNNSKHFTILLLILVSLVTKTWHISSHPIQLDEPFTIFTSNLGWADFCETFINENNPPLHFIIIKLIIYLFGFSEFALRFFSVLCMSFSLYFVYKSAQYIKGWESGIIASTLMLFSNLILVYSHQVRAYALLVLLASMGYYFIIKVIKKGNWSDIFGLGFSIGLLAYNHFMGIVFSCFLASSLFLYWKDPNTRKNLFVSFTIGVLLYAPYLPIFVTRFLDSSGGTWVQPPEGIMDIYILFWKFFNKPIPTVLAIILFVTGNVIWYKKDKIILLNHALLYLSFIGLFLLSLVIPLYLDRYLIFIAPVLYVQIGLNISRIQKIVPLKLKWGSLILPILLMLTFKIDSDINQSQDKKWAEIEKFKKNTAVIVDPKWERLNYCYYSNVNKYFVTTRDAFEATLIDNNIYNKNNFPNTYFQNLPDTIIVSSSGEIKSKLYRELAINYNSIATSHSEVTLLIKKQPLSSEEEITPNKKLSKL